MTKVMLTGGGTAGHVMGNIAILPGLRDRGYEIEYIGSKNGIERDLIAMEGLPYFPIASGKLRRYLSWNNVGDVFRVVGGVFDALAVLKKQKPDIIFSKGGYVSVPVALTAALLGIPFIGHESDLTPGLANKLAARYAEKMLVTFPETKAYFKDKGVVVGSPVRDTLFTGNRAKALQYLGFTEDKPILLIVGGSLGAVILNQLVWDNLDILLKDYQIVHLIGKDNGDPSVTDRVGYRQVEYAGPQMKDILAASDFIVSRAGSNSLFEFLALKKPNLLIPLDFNQSRGDQVLNAQSFAAAGYSLVLREADLTSSSFLVKLTELKENAADFIQNMEQAENSNAVEHILTIIDETLTDSRKNQKNRTKPAEAPTENEPVTFDKTFPKSNG